MGYKIAVLRQGEPVEADLSIATGHYLGWARSTNILARHIVNIDPLAYWVVGGGDDYFPDPTTPASEIGRQTSLHFAKQLHQVEQYPARFNSGTFGIMQPTGDRWGDDALSRGKYGADRGAYIDRVAGSPWMGRDWIQNAYLGNGPMWDGYHHCFPDEELQEVAIKMGVFQQRRDLTQYHDHPGRKSFDMSGWPPHLAPAITGVHWDNDQSMFTERKRKGFPGHEALPRRLPIDDYNLNAQNRF
jgi:hypothetical protein